MSDLVEAVADKLARLQLQKPLIEVDPYYQDLIRMEARSVLALPAIATALRLAEAHMAYVDYVLSNEPHDGIKQGNLYADDAEALAAYREARRP